MMIARGCLGALLSLALVASACAPSAGKAPDGTALPSAIIDPYLEIQKVLADDSTASIKANAASIAAAATALGAPAMKIDSAALELSAAAAAADPDIADVREKFGLLSEAIDAYMTGLQLTPPAGVHVAFCPMANKPWMQKGEALANPYYGKEMATCGTLRQ